MIQSTNESESAIDNATRGLLNLGQLPVTCGLFFSLGHSTIVVVVVNIVFNRPPCSHSRWQTVAIAISSGIYRKFNSVGEVGGIVGRFIITETPSSGCCF
jgi:high-affinity nickel-transport protein